MSKENKINWDLVIPLLITILMIGLTYYFKWGFIIGFSLGCIAMTITILKPSPLIAMILDNAFGYSKSQLRTMQNETEKTNKENKFKVRFKR